MILKNGTNLVKKKLLIKGFLDMRLLDLMFSPLILLQNPVIIALHMQESCILKIQIELKG